MSNTNCPTVTPSTRNLKPWQTAGLELVARLHGGRDVVLAIDLTESVGFNDEGQIRIGQIVEDSLQSGDLVYVVPFASTVNPLSAHVNPLLPSNSLRFQGKQDISKVLQKIPFQPDLTLRNTDIQQAELFVYQNLAQLNYCRLRDNKPILRQSVVWITDAPLFTQQGITSEDWIETPAPSQFRDANSKPSIERIDWFKTLNPQERSLSITTDDGEVYKLSVVDIKPSVVEFCTPVPGGEETCLVTPYLVKQLWLPTSVLALALVGVIFVLLKWLSWQKKWKLTVDFDPERTSDDKICFLPHNKRIAIGEYEPNSIDAIDCPGEEGVRAYLERKGNGLFLVPTKLAPIYYNGQKITKRTPISATSFRINCPFGRDRDYEFTVRITK